MSSSQQPQDKNEPGYVFGFKPGSGTIRSHGARTAAANCQYMMPTLQAKASSNPHLKLLDVGCGPGSITLDLAALVPEAEVIGFDYSETVLEAARASAEKRGIKNAKFMQGNAYHLPFADGEFDIVNTHQVVAHLTRHVEAIKELVRVTKPGSGALCMREGIIDSLVVGGKDGALLTEGMQVVMKTSNAEGANGSAGLYLKSWTMDAGVPVDKINYTMHSWSYSTDSERKEFGRPWVERMVQGDLADRAIKHGFATKERMEEYSKAWARFCDDDTACMGMIHGEVIVQA